MPLPMTTTCGFMPPSPSALGSRDCARSARPRRSRSAPGCAKPPRGERASVVTSCRCAASVPFSIDAGRRRRVHACRQQRRRRSLRGASAPCRSRAWCRERASAFQSGSRRPRVPGHESDAARDVAMGDRDAEHAGTAMPAVMPGIDLDLDACAAPALRSSSPPRPNTNGSPPFSRATVFPCFACRTISFSMKACGVDLQPPRLPTSMMRASGRACARQPRFDQVVDQHDVGRGRARAPP